jgi:hypothetical protein
LGLVLSMRAESFHQALSESMGLAGRAAARLQERLEAAISAELRRSRASSGGHLRTGGCGMRSWFIADDW